ncbi:hypothetical protein MNBD_GAMMA03-1318 [hydrothermal vent metagenome]|uniref:DUF4398 domain-containing protein n=1 Tax=hydrothermal vent metagenome TaxID=652676 RepID=A0A3B0WCP8_9ZZZZ
MKKLLISATLLTVATLTGCSTTQTNPTSYSDIVTQAKSLHADASNTGYAWKQKKMKTSYVEYYLAQAENAKNKGDETEALKAAQAALKTAKAEIAQREDAINLKATWEK